MRLSFKLALVLFAGTGSVWAVANEVRERQERALLEQQARADQVELGRFLADAWRQPDQWRSANALLQRLVRGPGGTRVLVLDRLDDAPPSVRDALARGEPATFIDTAPDPDQVVTYLMATPRDGEASKVVRLSDDLQEPERESHQLLFRGELLAAAVSALLALAAGQLFVEHPMRRLIARLQRIGSREVAPGSRPPDPPPVHDEFVALTAAIDRMEARLQEARDRLANEVAAHLIATEQLRHADRLAKGGMILAGFAHEISTPLDVIASRARPLAASADPKLADTGRVIVDQVGSLARSSRRLLDYTRKTTGTRQPFDLRAIAEDAGALLQPAIEGKSVQLAVDGPPVRVMGDPFQMLQAVLNLAHNGIQAMPDGGDLRLHTERRGGDAVLEIEDHGQGIAPEHRAHLFEPFFTTKPPGRGTGLGLPVSREIVREHGGAIEFDSEPGRGSRFRIVLPAVGA